MTNNYLKVKHAKHPNEFFPFDDQSLNSYVEALRSARAVGGDRAIIVVYRVSGCVELNERMRCVGHAPQLLNVEAAPGEPLCFRCQNCGQETGREADFTVPNLPSNGLSSKHDAHDIEKDAD